MLLAANHMLLTSRFALRRSFFVLVACGIAGICIACSQRSFDDGDSDGPDDSSDDSGGEHSGNDSDDGNVPDGDAIWDTSRWGEARFGK